MEKAQKMMGRVAAILAALGLTLMAAGFVLSGLDWRVFSASVDCGAVTLGGVEVEDPEDVPLLGLLATMGKVEVNVPAAPEAPAASAAPVASEAPAAS